MMWGHSEADLMRLHDGLLDDAAAARVRAHLAECTRCRNVERAIAFNEGALETLREAAMAESHRENVKSALLAAHTANNDRARAERTPRPSLWRAARMSAAAAVVIVIAAVSWWLRPHVRFVPGPAQSRSIESFAIAQHAAWTNAASTRATVSMEAARDLVGRHTGIRPKLKAGNRGIVATRNALIASAKASALLYRIESRPVTLVVARAATLADAPPSMLATKRLELRESGNMRVFTWTASGDAYSLAVPHGVTAARACAICHEGTRTMSLIEESTRDLERRRRW